MPHLLDTNACIQLMRDPFGRVARRLAAHAPAAVVVCSVVVAELLRGVRLSADPAVKLVRVGEFLDPLASLPFDDAAADVYARVRVGLDAAGTPGMPHDLMIAAIALSRNLTVVTHNTADFARVPGLRIEDWQTP